VSNPPNHDPDAPADTGFGEFVAGTDPGRTPPPPPPAPAPAPAPAAAAAITRAPSALFAASPGRSNTGAEPLLLRVCFGRSVLGRADEPPGRTSR